VQDHSNPWLYLAGSYTKEAAAPQLPPNARSLAQGFGKVGIKVLMNPG